MLHKIDITELVTLLSTTLIDESDYQNKRLITREYIDQAQSTESAAMRYELIGMRKAGELEWILLRG